MKKMINIFVVFLPILSLYKSPIPSLDLGTLLILICFCIYLFGKKSIIIKKDSITIIWFVYLLYVVISFLLNINYNSQDIMFYFGRLIKNLVYVFILLLSYSSDFFQYDILHKWFYRLAFFSTFFMMLQSFFYNILHIPLYGYIRTLIITDSYANRLIDINSSFLYRPTSIFYEPAHYFNFVIIALVILLFSNYEPTKNDLKKAVFISVGIVLSTSGQGVVIAALVWLMWLSKNLLRAFEFKYVIYLIIILLTFILFLNSEFGKIVIDRAFNLDTTGGNAILARTEGYELLKNLSPEKILLGNGYGILPEAFIPSWGFNLYCLGIIGSGIVLLIYIVSYKKSRSKSMKIIIILNFLISIFSTVFNGYYVLFFFSFVYSKIIYDERPSNEDMCISRQLY